MAIENFYSVERMGYTRVSDVMLDVFADMVNTGFFSVVNCSNITSSDVAAGNLNVVALKTTVVSLATPIHKVSPGDRLILDPHGPLTPPTFAGESRAPLYVYVNQTDAAGASGNVTLTSDVRSDFEPSLTNGYDISLIYNQIDVGTSANVDLYTADVNGHATTTKVATIRVDKYSTPLTQYNAIANSNIIDPTTGLVINKNPDSFSFTLDVTAQLDPITDNATPPDVPMPTQPWRLQFTVTDEQMVSGAIATALQMNNDPAAGHVTISKITDDTGAIIDSVGSIGGLQTNGQFVSTDVNEGFYNRKIRVANQSVTYPMNYRLTMANRGFFLGVWEGNWSTQRAAATASSNYFNWVVVQRPVDRNTGATLVQGKCPVFMVNGVNYKYYKMIVRESDVLHPTARVPADQNTIDNCMLFNSQNQIVLTEDKTYLLTFPHNLTTPRFRYTEELDLMGTTSADVVMAGQQIQFRAYGELGARTYAALPPAGANNTGLRIAALCSPQGPWWPDQAGGAYDPAGASVIAKIGTNATFNDPYPLGDISHGLTVLPTTNVTAAPITDSTGIARNPPKYYISSGKSILHVLGIDLDKDTGNFVLGGAGIQAAAYTQPTDIVFTVDAVNAEDLDRYLSKTGGGYTSKDFFFTYIPS